MEEDPEIQCWVSLSADVQTRRNILRRYPVDDLDVNFLLPYVEEINRKQRSSEDGDASYHYMMDDDLDMMSLEDIVALFDELNTNHNALKTLSKVCMHRKIAQKCQLKLTTISSVLRK